MLTDDVLIEIFKIIKKSKLLILNSKNLKSQYTFQKYQITSDYLQQNLQSLSEIIQIEGNKINGRYKSKTILLNRFRTFFIRLNLYITNLVKIHNALEKEVSQYINLHHIPKDKSYNLILFFVNRKILMDYLAWCDQVECALLNMADKNISFIPNLKFEMMLYKIINNLKENRKLNTKETDPNLSFLAGLGLGIWFD